ncbi:MAG TPA: hypothetical protein VKT51_05610 [Candidatus Eremiobacteraceae bacterium]|nr:hypothetical protein [Candidatus Eremiobacteraceae bacterium]
MSHLGNSRDRVLSACAIGVLAFGLTVAGISRAHAARWDVSPDKACSNGSSCFSIVQNGPGEGIVAASQLGNSFEGHSKSGNALFGETHNLSGTTKHCASGVIGLDLSSDGGILNFGVSGRSYHGTGVFGSSGSAAGLFGESKSGTGIFGRSASATMPALGLQATGSGPLMIATNAGGGQALSLDQGGNLTISGVIKTGGSCNEGCSQSRNGHGARLVSYMPRESSPTMEDFGEGQLVNGIAAVRIDPAFANAIDQSRDYLVFLTPDGDTKGLYVAERSIRGFVVRESQGGRSNVQFSYRIVAKPFGKDEPRLPIVQD